MRYIDHEPSAWFLVEHDGALLLDARYSYSALIDTSALVRLDDDERESYRSGGHDYLSDLAHRIHHSGPYRSESPYYARDLYRSSDGPTLRAQVSTAIADHTWIAEQRRASGGHDPA